MAEITYQAETLDKVRSSGIDELLKRHWHEIAHFKDIPLDVAWPVYEKAEAMGQMRIYTARIGQEIIGYVAYMVAPNPHYQGSLQAVQDVLYLAPEYRGRRTGLNLIRYADMQLAAEGVQAVYQHSKVALPLDAILKHLGYEPVDVLWVKRLD